jgi:hypothetical protein
MGKNIWPENLKEKSHSENTAVHGKIILRTNNITHK